VDPTLTLTSHLRPAIAAAPATAACRRREFRVASWPARLSCRQSPRQEAPHVTAPLAAFLPERALCPTFACLNIVAGSLKSGGMLAWQQAGAGSMPHGELGRPGPGPCDRVRAARTIHPHLPAEAPGAQRRVLPVVLHEAHLRAAPPHETRSARTYDAGGARWRERAGPARTGPGERGSQQPGLYLKSPHIIRRTHMYRMAAVPRTQGSTGRRLAMKDCRPMKNTTGRWRARRARACRSQAPAGCPGTAPAGCRGPA